MTTPTSNTPAVVAADLLNQATAIEAQATAAGAVQSSLTNVAKALRADAAALANQPPPPPPPTGTTLGKRWGAFSMPLEQVQNNAGLVTQQADYLKDLGVGWWRGDYPPAMYNPAKGSYNWGAVDVWVTAALQRGIQPLPILYILPGWMNGGGNDKKPPINDADYAQSVAEAAKHLASLGCNQVELWNEQNLGGFWSVSPVNDDTTRGKYTRMMSAAYPAIKAVAPKTTVVLGGLSTADDMASNPTPPGHGMLATLSRYADLGTFKYCDAVAWHPYLDNDTPCKDVDVWPSWSPKAVAAALAQIDRGAPGRNLQLWTTESGCPRSAVGGDQGQQSQRIKDAYNALLPGGCLAQYASRLGPFFCFTVIDRATGDGREDSFGWVSKGGGKYQVYNDMKQVFAHAL